MVMILHDWDSDDSRSLVWSRRHQTGFQEVKGNVPIVIMFADDSTFCREGATSTSQGSSSGYANVSVP